MLSTLSSIVSIGPEHRSARSSSISAMTGAALTNLVSSVSQRRGSNRAVSFLIARKNKYLEERVFVFNKVSQAALISGLWSRAPKIRTSEEIISFCLKHEEQVHVQFPDSVQETERASSRAAVSFPEHSCPENKIEGGSFFCFIS